jgi:hypothetical protein
MPAKGISLHLGLNGVDPNQYEGWDGQLAACEFDAKDMKSLAEKQGFKARVLLTSQVTSATVIAAITDAAKQLKSGDFFLLTYSGHGGQVPDTNHDEQGQGDRQDETWVFYDRQLVDDELYALWAKFAAGVRIAVLSDSCHSGTVTRAFVPKPAGNVRTRLMPPAVAERTYRAHKKLYDGIQKTTPAGESQRVRSTVLLISGCQDNQTSLDGRRNGLFTEKLRKAWAGGKFKGTMKTLRDKIVASMPPEQTPNYYKVGANNPGFEGQKPFVL